MIFFYTLFIYFYGFLIRIVALFNAKAKAWKNGRKNIWQSLETTFTNNTSSIIWFHAASLGEFEQARPLIEKIKSQSNNHHKILITFFSPSGFEIMKDYEYADYIFYIPLDTPKNARKFLDLIKPVYVFWVKYDLWFHHLQEIQKRNIPCVLFSAIFRTDQFMFKWYGKPFRKIIQNFTKIFVQDENSIDVLENNQITNVINVGDTRFDRVKETSLSLVHLPQIANFQQDKKLFVIGSCWNKDLDVLIPFLTHFENPLKIIIAPHEIKENILERIEEELPDCVRYSKITEDKNFVDKKILIIDNIGMLSRIYAYADFAYIGGAFGEGLHNILEPATFGVPIFFGDEYERFPEADELVEDGGAFSVSNAEELELYFDRLYSDEEKRKQVGQICKNYVNNHTGGTEKIFRFFSKVS
ncbi:MAG: 3-deoxy-D-manno-octulosonic acid transferase [Bacteroidetes bacterium]|nr:MAG: 3-deoxy-D-manno-octulosonic acid transferase [Bacteroidota bacterium]TAG85537.1 MAG: 3-deoxy-D-manno-octulosonic acid transferase [Bacteroidota bacterium]